VSRKSESPIAAAGPLPHVVFSIDGDKLAAVPLLKRTPTVAAVWAEAVSNGVFVAGERVRIGIADAMGNVVGWLGYRTAPQVFDTEVSQ
jgi:hypothetical protein